MDTGRLARFVLKANSRKIQHGDADTEMQLLYKSEICHSLYLTFFSSFCSNRKHRKDDEGLFETTGHVAARGGF